MTCVLVQLRNNEWGNAILRIADKVLSWNLANNSLP